MKSSDVKEKIAAGNKIKFLDEGFVYVKSSNEFICKKNDVSYIFNILQSNWAGNYTLSVRLFLNCKKVEQIIKKITGKTHGLTMGNSLERIAGEISGVGKNKSMFITIFQDEDISAASESIGDYFDKYGKLYFNKYQSLEDINKVINNVPFDICPIDVGGIFADRCIRGLVVARLVDNNDYEKLALIYDEIIKLTENNESIAEYYKVRDYLK